MDEDLDATMKRIWTSFPCVLYGQKFEPIDELGQCTSFPFFGLV